ncbi:MAG: tRNA pseudouridine(55) synthase TruB [Bifidobacteriaceae bacterium]|jgi:tRNA pseudouridine55 synthase|nr:tRNA pseudouridine(55) synthase TruB [Bifidobacteriaceae bacterium]
MTVNDNAPKSHTADSFFLLVDKPSGCTSFDVVAKIRRQYAIKSVGHSGTLDPLATGLLLIAVGKNATRLLEYFTGADKEYLAEIQLGTATTTDDSEGETIAVADIGRLESVTPQGITHAVSCLTGEISQVPSAFSAIKVDGKRAYDLARKGKDVKLPARKVTIYDFTIQNTAHNTITAKVSCSKGTYIRALARDLGEKLGTFAHITMLHRTKIGNFNIENAGKTLSLEDAIKHVMPVVEVTVDDAKDLSFGRKIRVPDGFMPKSGSNVGVIYDGELVAVSELSDGMLAPKKVLRVSH